MGIPRLLQLLKKLLLPRKICQQIILLFLQLLNKPKRQLKNQKGKNKCAVLGAVFAKIKTQRHGVIKARRIAKVPVTVNTLIPKYLSLKAVVHGMENATLKTFIATGVVKIV